MKKWEFKRQQQFTNFYSSRIISSCVLYSEGGRIFSCLFGCLFLRYVFLSVFLPLVVLWVIGCHTYFLKRSSECPLISFDKDQPNTILIATITDNLRRSSVLGSRIVVNMSLPPLNQAPKASLLSNETWQNLPSTLLLFVDWTNTLGVELLSIGSNPPPQQMRDEFSMNVVS
jgi:hypothetical protein